MLESGYVLTSLHLTEGVGEERLRDLFAYGSVGSPEGQQYRLEYIDEETQHDLMLLRFSPSVAGGLMQACVRETASRVGEKIAILGFPLGGSLFLSRGEVSRIEAAKIETTATIAGGSSGSPVFDDEGKVNRHCPRRAPVWRPGSRHLRHRADQAGGKPGEPDRKLRAKRMR